MSSYGLHAAMRPAARALAFVRPILPHHTHAVHPHCFCQSHVMLLHRQAAVRCCTCSITVVRVVHSFRLCMLWCIAAYVLTAHYFHPQAEVQQILDKIDVNGNSRIDYEEFLAATMHLSKLNREENMVRELH